LKYASGDFLLFLDCDAKIISENFLKIIFNSSKKIKKVKWFSAVSRLKRNAYFKKKYSLEREIVPLEKEN
jgi:predicted glycosyltransferase involved in capsule biosynthesis